MNFQEEGGIYTKTWRGERILGAVAWGEGCATTPWGPCHLTRFDPYPFFFLFFDFQVFPLFRPCI